MSFEGYFTEHDDVLENKLGITDPKELQALEAEVVAIRMSELLSSPPKGKMDFAYLKRVHRKLFSDLYQMAGKTRTVDIAKGGSAFCYAQFIEGEQQHIFNELQSTFTRRRLDKHNFTKALTKLSADLNALHPFREGNGRAIRCFLILLAARYNYHLDFDRVDSERLLQSDIAAFNGNLESLEQLYYEIISDEASDD